MIDGMEMFIVLFGALLTILFVIIKRTTMVLINTWRDYKEKSKSDKKDGTSINLIKAIMIWLGTIAIAGALIVTCIGLYRKTVAYKFTQVTSTVEDMEALYEVHIDSVVAEKDKEDIYYITLSNNKMTEQMSQGIFSQTVNPTKDCPLFRMYGDEFIHSDKISACNETFRNIKLELTESEYESIIGSGNNHLWMNVSILTLKTEKYRGRQCSSVLYRFDCFSKGTFSDQEVREIKEQFFKCINDKELEENDLGSVYADFVVVDLQ